MERHEGSVKSWKEPWGWISSPSAGADVFAHIQDVVSGNMSRDAAVTFVLGTDQKSGKPRAMEIEVTGVGERSDGEVGPRLTGTIESWKEAWGWIASPDLEENIFGHKEDLVIADPTAGVQVGGAVRFDVGVDAKSGKPRAKRIELLDQAEKMTGEVASWKDQWGWIRCDELDGGDIFAHSDDLLTIVQVGVKVTFECGTDKKSGKRRALNIAAVGAKGGKGGPPMHGRAGGYGKGGPPMGQPMMRHDMMMGGGCGKGMMMGGPGHFGGKGGGPAHFGGGPMPGFGGKGGLPGPQAFIGQQLEGRVAMWKDLWGWISCPLFGGDIFAHKEDLQGGATPGPGSPVFFIPGTDNKGRMRALMIQAPGGKMGGKGGVKRKSDGGAPRPGEEDFQQLEGSVIDGEVTHWKSPWGWIQSPHYTGDLFGHKEDVLSGQELEVGQQVTFMVARDHKSGRWRARQINDGNPEMPKKRRVN